MIENERPRIRAPFRPIDRLLQVVGIAGAAGLLLVSVRMRSLVPDRVPLHFGFSGRPDRWGSPDELWLIPLIGILLFVGLAFVSRIPHAYNYPWPVTPENAERQYALARRLILALQALVIWLFLGLLWGTIRVATGAAERLSPFVLVFTLGGTALLIVSYFIVASRER